MTVHRGRPVDDDDEQLTHLEALVVAPNAKMKYHRHL